MSDDDLLKEFLPRLKARLAEICGNDLAESLVVAARGGGELNLDMQLVINDGLDHMDEEMRTRVLDVLSDIRNQVRQAKMNA